MEFFSATTWGWTSDVCPSDLNHATLRMSADEQIVGALYEHGLHRSLWRILSTYEDLAPDGSILNPEWLRNAENSPTAQTERSADAVVLWTNPLDLDIYHEWTAA